MSRPRRQFPSVEKLKSSTPIPAQDSADAVVHAGRKIHGSKSAARFLTEQGYRTAASHLDTLVSRGGGPPFFKYGKYRMYEEQDLLDWAMSRCSGKRTSSSQAEAA